jgi:hypothetical protein
MAGSIGIGVRGIFKGVVMNFGSSGRQAARSDNNKAAAPAIPKRRKSLLENFLVIPITYKNYSFIDKVTFDEITLTIM